MSRWARCAEPAMARASSLPRRLALAAGLALASALAHADDYDVLRDRWRLRLDGCAASEAASAQALRDWRGLDTAADRRALWPDLADWSRSATLYDNVRRLRTLALAWSQPDSPLHGDPALARAIVDALDWLQAQHYNAATRYHDNWWHWQIGVPLVLDDIATLMHDELGDARLARTLAAIDHFVPDPATHLLPDGRVRPGAETGANRLDKALAVALRGVLGKSGAKIAAARDAVGPALAWVDHGDGFYRDGSFIQHEVVPYAGGYGLSVLADMAQLLSLLRDSPWTLTDPALAHVYDWVEDSYRPFLFDGVMIDAVNGRKVSRRHEDDRTTAQSVMGSLALLAQGAPRAQADRIRSLVRGWALRSPGPAAPAAPSCEAGLLAAIAGDATVVPADEPVGLRFFPAQDRAVLRGPGFAWSLSLFSDRISAFESGNDENLHGWWTGIGMTTLYQGGASPHADGFWATVDARRLPGTTTDHSGQGRPVPWAMHANSAGPVGGATLGGELAALGMAFSTAGVTGSHLRGRKSWFVFGDRILALGSDLSTPDPVDVETIVENRLLDGAAPRTLTIDGQPQPAAVDWQATVASARWAHLGGGGSDAGVGYVFPGTTALSAWRERRTGRWSEINGATKPVDDAPVTRDYAGLAIDHGTAPVHAAYAYVVLPGRSAAQTAAFAAAPAIAVLANTPAVSAACDATSGAIAAIAWAPLRPALQVGGRDWLTTDAGLALVARHRADTLALSLADPSRRLAGTVHVELGEAVASTLEADPRITVERTAPTLRLAIRPDGLAGASIQARFRLRRSPDAGAACPATP